ncbi:MAG TPA: hypothetical protein VF791_07540 [Pyrinomonadaceae bacterium]
MLTDRFRSSQRRDAVLLVVYLAAAVIFAQAAFAQSGRRQNKSAPTPPAPQVPEESQTVPAAQSPAVKPATVASLIVGGDKLSASIYVSSYVDVAVDACMERLKEFPGFEVAGGGNMTRKDASDRAKKEQDAYVLWLELKLENDVNADSVLISYHILKPQTGKILTTGRVYLGAKTVGRGSVGVGVPSVSKRLPLQYQVKEGGHEVADRVRGKLLSNPLD